MPWYRRLIAAVIPAYRAAAAPQVVPDAEARYALRALAHDAGGYTALAAQLGCSVQYVHRAATGRTAITGRLLPALGLVRRSASWYERAQ